MVEGRIGVQVGDEMARLVAAGPPDEAALAAVVARYGLETDRSSIPVLARRFGLRLG